MKTRNLVFCGLFAALIAVGAFIKIPIGIVPLSLQLMFVMLCALTLGGRLSAIAILCYCLIGLVGLPVFTKGGGIGYIFEPTFGYLLGFIFGAFLTGTLSKMCSHKNGAIWFFLCTLAGEVVVYIFGLTYFYFITKFVLGMTFSFSYIMIYCFLVFLPGDILSCIIASVVGKRLVKVLYKDRQQIKAI